MGTATTIVAGERRQDAARTPKKGTLAVSSARLLSWKTVLVQSLGRELHALHRQQQERAFMATSHGLNYTVLKMTTRSEVSALH